MEMLRDERAFNGLALLTIREGAERPGNLNTAPGLLTARERRSSVMAPEGPLLTQPSHECVRALSAPPPKRAKSPAPVAPYADVEQRRLIARAESKDSGRRRDGARDDGLVVLLPWSPSHPSPLLVRWLSHRAPIARDHLCNLTMASGLPSFPGHYGKWPYPMPDKVGAFPLEPAERAAADGEHHQP